VIAMPLGNSAVTKVVIAAAFHSGCGNTLRWDEAVPGGVEKVPGASVRDLTLPSIPVQD